MNKLDLLAKKLLAAKEELEKARQKMSDEYDPNDMDERDDVDPDLEGLREFDPDEEESAGADWLKENDPEAKTQGDEYDEYSDDEDPEAHQRSIDEDYGDDEANVPSTEAARPSETKSQAPQQVSEAQRAPQEAAQQVKGSSRWNQPTREELMELRQHTRPWEQRARDTAALRADPSKNPQLARHGNIVEARQAAHGDRASKYREFMNSPEYKNADPIAQMDMDDQFEQNWQKENPSHLADAMKSHHEAHEKGRSAKDMHASAKDAQIKNILTGGGHGGEGFSMEEGMQHAGGTKGDTGTQATVVQDPASSFAMGNQDFIRQYAEDYGKKNKKVNNFDDMEQHDEGSKRDIARILGGNQAKNPKFEKFFEHYHPLIAMNAKRAVSTMGLDPANVDMDMLHEAGMHGLVQAMNDYDHDNPGKAAFSTHAANKIRGLQMTAMKGQDAIPTEVRQAQKKFSQTQSGGQPQPAAPAPAVSKPDVKAIISGHPEAANIHDRMKRVVAAKGATKIRKASAPPLGGSKPPGGSTPSGTGGEV